MSQAENVSRGCRTIALVATLLWSVGSAAQQEVPGAKDFPLIKRYEGSRLIGYDSRPFDTAKLIVGKLTLGDNGQPAADSVRELEGRHTRLLYLAPPTRSSLEVFRNYENELKAKGFTILFKCSGEEQCESVGAELYRVLYPPTNALQTTSCPRSPSTFRPSRIILRPPCRGPRVRLRSRYTLPSIAARPFRRPRIAWPSCSTSSRTSPWNRRW